MPEFKYLGAQIVNTDKDISLRKAQAWSAFWQLRKIWFSKTIKLHLKIKIFKMTCLTVFLYGCETWVVSSQQQLSINAFPTSCYRIILEVKRTDRIPNNQILEQTKQVDLYETVKLRQLKFIGHLLRMQKDEPCHIYALYEPSNMGHRNRGRQPMNYRKYIASILGDEALQAKQIEEYASNREEWKKLVAVRIKAVE